MLNAIGGPWPLNATFGVSTSIVLMQEPLEASAESVEPSAVPVSVDQPPGRPGRWDLRPKLRWLGAEFAVIVLGVLVALGVDQAVDNRRDRALERTYLAALTSDVEADLAQLRTNFFPHLDEREAIARELIGAVEGRVPVDVKRLAVALDWAGHLRIFQPQRSTYDDLVATGNLRLIRDREVRAEVGSYFDVTQLSAMHELIRREIWYGYRDVVDEVLDPLILAEITRLESEIEGVTPNS